MVILGLWSLVTGMGWVKPLFLPSPAGGVEHVSVDDDGGFAGGTLLAAYLVSFLRVFGAFALATVIGVPLGLAMGMSRVMRAASSIRRSSSTGRSRRLAYLPLMIIWFGIGEMSKVLLIFLSILAPLALGTRAGVRSAAIEQIHAAYSMGASRWQVLMQVILPAAMPEILTSMRIGIGFGWTTLVAAEMVAATQGIGYHGA